MEDMLWEPAIEFSRAEERIAARAAKKRKLFVFLREHRHDIFDAEFQRELCAMYRQTGAGKPPIPPAILAMATLLQAYWSVADHEVVELTVDSRRWQMVLDSLDKDEPLFSQGALYDFRMRLIASDMDRRLLERTIEVARESGGFGATALRAALDSSPLWGHGRVEDTFNLLAHASHKVLQCIAQLTEQTMNAVIEQIGLSLFSDEKSVKALLDVDWSEAEQRHAALQRLVDEITALQQWVHGTMAVEADRPPLSDALETVERLMAQDLEPDPDGGARIRDGVAKDRQVSVEDPDARHGRKSSTKRVDGFKRHIARDIDERLILAVDVLPANEPDTSAISTLLAEVDRQGRQLASLHIDRGYLGSEVAGLDEEGVHIVCKPWMKAGTKGRFGKRDFEIDTEKMKATCPAGVSIDIRIGSSLNFPAETCESCPLREQCTSNSRGRSLRIHEDEDLHQRLQKLSKTPEGRAALRERTDVEHGLAHISQRQGNRARYNGTRKNVFHLRMAAAVQNLEAAQRYEAAA